MFRGKQSDRNDATPEKGDIYTLDSEIIQSLAS